MPEPGLRSSTECRSSFVSPLLQKYNRLHPQMISVSAVVGITIFYSAGLALAVAGPWGTLLAFILNGAVGICVVEGLSEMIQMFPAPNAIMEYIRHFVDPDLAWVAGISYWYTNASLFLTLILAAAEFYDFWEDATKIGRVAVFYIFAPVVILFINFWGVKYFGWLETLGGFIKICLVLGVGVFMFVVHGQSASPVPPSLYRQLTLADPPSSQYIDDGFTHNSTSARNGAIAECIVLPIIAFGFVSLEMTAITAFEARSLQSLRRASRTIGYFIFLIYLFCVVGQLLNVHWRNPSLPPLTKRGQPDHLQSLEKSIAEGITTGSSGSIAKGNTTEPHAILIIAALRSNNSKIPGFLNGCLIFSALSASNSALYISSRILYGMTRTINPWRGWRWLRVLGTVWHRNGVPMWAVLFSAVSFAWLPLVKLSRGNTTTHLIQILSTTSSVSCLLVWASLCLAYIRYHSWLNMHRLTVEERYPGYARWAITSQSSTFLEGIQPLPAWIGFIGSLLIVFTFTTATWWSTPFTLQKFATAYGSPVFLTIFLIVLKLITRRPPVILDKNIRVLLKTLADLRSLRPVELGNVDQGSEMRNFGES